MTVPTPAVEAIGSLMAAVTTTVMGPEDVPSTRWWVHTGDLEENESEAFCIHGELYVTRESCTQDEEEIVIGTQTGWLVPGTEDLARVCDDTHAELAQAAEV